jgi:D-glycero-D-manno-heptose 1,7-bisphosphate phosphatase
MSKAAVFFDRDDTLMRNVPYLGDPSQVVLFPGVADALEKLHDADFELFIVSNQSGVGRGLITIEQVARVTEEMIRQLGEIRFTGVYNCYAAPGQPGEEHRKPSPYLIQQAATEHKIDLAKSFMVGDRLSDVLSGKNAGCKSLLVLTGPSSPERDIARTHADYIAADLIEAAEWIVREAKGKN